MKRVHGKVGGGKIEVEGEPLKEGSTVTVVAHDDDETFELSPRQEAELARAIEEADKGDFIDGDEFLRSLSHQG